MGYRTRHGLKLLEEQLPEVVAKYNELSDMVETAKFFNVSTMTIHNYLKRMNAPIREHGRIYNTNHDIFNTIDTEEKAYWLGFLSADGCVSDEFPLLALTISDRDESHLAKYASFMGENPITYSNRTTKLGKKVRHVSVRIRSKRIKEALIELGVTPRKSHTLEPCSAVPDNLSSHYWRGLIDGDGWIIFNRAKCRGGTFQHCSIGLVGSKAICNGFKQFINDIIGVSTDTKVVYRQGCFRLEISGFKKVQPILDYLYRGSTLYLDRKAEKARSILLYQSKNVKPYVSNCPLTVQATLDSRT